MHRVAAPSLDAEGFRKAGVGAMPPNDDGDDLPLFIGRGLDPNAMTERTLAPDAGGVIRRCPLQ